MSTSTLLPTNHLLLHAVVSASSALMASLLNLPVLSLHGLHTYIHPDNLPTDNTLRAQIRRPSDPQSDPNPKRRSKSNQSNFDESKAQLFRLRLADSHLQTRLFFPNYRNSFLFSAVSLSNLSLHLFFLRPDPVTSPAIPALAGLLSTLYLVCFLFRLSFERSAFKRSERQLSLLSGFLGFLFALLVLFTLSPTVFDFEIGAAKAAAAPIAGFLAGILFVPAARAARSFWLGTDQLRWNLSVVSCGPYAGFLLYVAVLLNVTAPLLWINPVAAAVDGFKEYRIKALVVSALLQLVVLRPNLQMYLNEAVLSWYQRLHASRVPDLDFGRAKVFLHNHYLCLVVMQFFGPPVLVLILLGLSQMRGNLFSGLIIIGGLEHGSDAIKEMAFFVAWWIVFVWGILTMSSLALYRCGILFVS